MFCVFSNLYHYITGSINSCMMSANLRASFQGCFNFLQDLNSLLAVVMSYYFGML